MWSHMCDARACAEAHESVSLGTEAAAVALTRINGLGYTLSQRPVYKYENADSSSLLAHLKKKRFLQNLPPRGRCCSGCRTTKKRRKVSSEAAIQALSRYTTLWSVGGALTACNGQRTSLPQVWDSLNLLFWCLDAGAEMPLCIICGHEGRSFSQYNPVTNQNNTQPTESKGF